MDLAAVGFPFQGFGKLWQRVPIKLVVAQDINDRCGGKLIFRPFASLAANMNVACQHDNIGIGHGNFGGSEFQVEIAQNVQAHRWIGLECSIARGIKVRAEIFASARTQGQPLTRHHSPVSICQRPSCGRARTQEAGGL